VEAFGYDKEGEIMHPWPVELFGKTVATVEEDENPASIKIFFTDGSILYLRVVDAIEDVTSNASILHTFSSGYSNDAQKEITSQISGREIKISNLTSHAEALAKQVEGYKTLLAAAEEAKRKKGGV
jgi:hypothetical protein